MAFGERLNAMLLAHNPHRAVPSIDSCLAKQIGSRKDADSQADILGLGNRGSRHKDLGNVFFPPKMFSLAHKQSWHKSITNV